MAERNSFLLTNLAAAASPAGAGAPLRGSDLGRVDVVAPAAIAVVDGLGRIAIPGLVDCHTHPAFGGDRAGEFDLRAQGAEYERIHAEGGGIAATVAATRRLGREGIAEAVARHIGWMAAH